MTKVNKQGVRDLSALKPTTPDFGKNQLPGEMAAQLLERHYCSCQCACLGENFRDECPHLQLQQRPAEFGAALSPQVQEFLHILAEECAETVQRVTKILRFGLRRNPWDGKDNIERLESEIGDICATLDVLAILKVIDPARISAHEVRKLQVFAVEENPAKPRLRHATDDLRDLIHQYIIALDAEA